MKNEINTQRLSPSSPQEQAEPHLEAGEGLDVTACSASYFIDYRVAFTQSVKAVREETNQNAIAYLINNGWIPLKVVNIDRKFPKYALGCVNMNHYDYDMVIADQMACLKHTQSFYHRCLVFASQIRGAISNLLMCRS
jgi:hypothetical protein